MNLSLLEDLLASIHCDDDDGDDGSDDGDDDDDVGDGDDDGY